MRITVQIDRNTHPTLADAILDRLVHNAHRLALTGESMRRVKASATAMAPQEPSVCNVTVIGGTEHAGA